MRLMFPLSLLNPEGEVGGPRGEGGLTCCRCDVGEVGRRGSPVMAERYIVAVPHSLHHLQLLLPITQLPKRPPLAPRLK